MDVKIFRDPIHGYIHLDELCMDIVDTAQFQRLRDLKQLGALYYVFPSASHNRFEHSIGTSHLAGQLVSRFQQQQVELGITEWDAQCVRIAGLCHDLGHGPFSHVFDNTFIPLARPGLLWSHEQASEMMLDALVDSNGIDLDQQQLRFIKSLIRGDSGDKAFLFDIVANKRNGVDVDKFDYISRDCHILGEPSSYDIKRLLNYSKVLDNQICYYHKEGYNVYQLFSTRYSLFKRIYTHRVAKGIEYMIVDAFLAADAELHISDAIDDADAYLRLTDCILKDIELSTSDELKESRDLVKRIRQRHLYKFVQEYVLAPHLKPRITRKDVNAVTIAAHSIPDSTNATKASEHDIIVDWLTIDFGFKDKNPVDQIKFFSRQSDTPFHIPKENVSLLIPQHFDETIVRVYTRNPQRTNQIQRAFRQLLAGYGVDGDGDGPSVQTPHKRRYRSHE
jgi:HD superfamily phosphohydrolase